MIPLTLWQYLAVTVVLSVMSAYGFGETLTAGKLVVRLYKFVTWFGLISSAFCLMWAYAGIIFGAEMSDLIPKKYTVYFQLGSLLFAAVYRDVTHWRFNHSRVKGLNTWTMWVEAAKAHCFTLRVLEFLGPDEDDKEVNDHYAAGALSIFILLLFFFPGVFLVGEVALYANRRTARKVIEGR